MSPNLIFLLSHTDGVRVGQWWADRADSVQVHGSPEDGEARLVSEHGRWRDLADQHFSKKDPEVCGSNFGLLG